ncbi:MAG: hypothetical protein UV89_C0020G0006 [candidate division WWE3 bacterium GW2011_GWB2_43_22]|uniref:Uncharacterized protein n=1 Tax=candidate division WWE3 bacterium GW2011_GWB2_43_22 TaxID=1619118 RepID=A0A0G1ELK5_UNCKA|nr:MAG: hypothetical protein UV89_C0020G0006 [candidate division WWE3 bacterium GW2011_GWB2_43_22]
MSASSPAIPRMIFAALSTSLIVRSGPPEILNRMPLAPSTDCSSNGEEIAALAATSALFSPVPIPIPINAVPASFIIVLTSAKSTFINPGITIRSEIPWTPWFKTLSDNLKASIMDMSSSATSKSFWFGIVIKASTSFLSSIMPLSAALILCIPSKLNGLVTTPIVRAPDSLAILATVGDAPVPVPPPRPAVIKTMFAPSRLLFITSMDSSAAFRPISGLEPAPKPCVSS